LDALPIYRQASMQEIKGKASGQVAKWQGASGAQLVAAS